jgi:hypothetical protein
MRDDITLTPRGAFPDDATLDRALARAEQQKADYLQAEQPKQPKPARGSGRVFPRGQVYWIAYCLHGKEYRESARTDNEKKAAAFLKHRMKEVGADQLGIRTFVTPQASRLTIHDLLEALKADFELRKISSPQNLSTIRKADAYFGEKRATDLTAEQIDSYIPSRKL